MTRIKIGSIAITIGLLVMSGCDTGYTDAGTDLASTVSVSGDENMELRAQARFELRDDPDVGRVFVISVEDPAVADQVVVLAGRGIPETATYILDDTEERAGGYILLGSGNSQVAYFVDSGTFHITFADSERLLGSFDLEASRFLDPAVTIDVTGTFEARPGILDIVN